MPDQEIVIKGLKKIANAIVDGYICEPDQAVNTIADTLALLKEQEPILVKYTTSTIRCPKCNKQITNRGALHNDINYCWKCGQAVKWNEIVYARNDGRASDAR